MGLSTFGDADPIERTWINQWIPRGVPVVLVGAPGAGKGLSTIAAAAAGSTGGYGAAFTTLLVAGEDDASDVRLRIDAAGGRADLIVNCSDIDGEPFNLTDHGAPALDALCDAVIAKGMPPVGLIVIDNLLSTCDGPELSTNVRSRKTLAPLAALAKKRDAGMILVHHFDQDGKTIVGSAGLVQAARLVLVLKAEGTAIKCTSVKATSQPPSI